MKRLRSILITITSIVMMCMYILPVKAAYSYKVTILAGLHGKVNGQDKVEITVAPGAFWYPKDYTVTVDDPRFYFKGFQESGIEDYGRGGAQAITKDTVFVARYGIAGKTVEYTVRYVDAAGNPLIAADTFYGNVGDKPVAMTAGSAVSSACFDVMFEKGLREYDGVYAVINNEFAKTLSDYKYINREEDLGIEGLRKAKLSYHPAIIYDRFSAIPND